MTRLPTPAGRAPALLAGVKRRRRIVHRPEEDFQTQCVRFARAAVQGIVIFHVTNEGRRSKIAGGKLKAAGLLAGVWDLVLVLPQGGIGFMEMKAKGRGLTPQQIDFRTDAEAWGAQFAQPRTLPEFEAVLREWYPRRVRATVLPTGVVRREV
jgi:hypothetical protein